jgi:haloacetate dehalogenase
MFYGFKSARVSGDGVSLFMRRKGAGPPVLLLHGFPQTHVMWHRVAPVLAGEFTICCADLRGCGASDKPPGPADHSFYSKRALAADLVRAMASLGFERFAVVGHDRGGRVAYRMALDHPACVTALAVLDIIPTVDAFAHADARMMQSFWPWSLLAQPAPLPERLIGADPTAIIDHVLEHWGTSAMAFPPALRDEYIRALSHPDAAHAICEEFRAAASLDISHDEHSRAQGQRIECPTLILWSRDGPLDRWYENRGGPLGIWRQWARTVSGTALDGGHFFPESNSKETIALLAPFLRGISVA